MASVGWAGLGSRRWRAVLVLGCLGAFVALAGAASALPDLQVSLAPAADVPDNSQVDINITLRNTGDAASGATSVAVAIDGNPTDPPLDFPPIAAGASVSMSVGFALSCGYHNVSASADPGDLVVEGSETNNNATAVAKVLPFADFATALAGSLGAYNLTANASPSHGCAPLSFAWEAIPGGDFSGEAVAFPASAGNVSLTLTVASQADATLAARVTHVITVPNRKPVLEVTVMTPEVLTGTHVLLQVNALDIDGTVEQYFADFADGNTTTALAEIVAHKFSQPGNYTVTLRVTDNLGSSNETTFVITVLNRQPFARVDPPYWFGEVGQEAEFNGSTSSDLEGGPLTYSWQFGDGAVGAGPVVRHTYEAAGAYSAVLTVTDERGASHSVTVTVQVLTPPGNSPGTSLLTVGFLVFLVVFVVAYVVKVRSRPPPPAVKGPETDSKKAEEP